MILKHNLFGLDICDRAAQLAQFAVMMKAREYDRNIFNKITELHICSIKDTNWLDFSIADELLIGVTNKDKATKQIRLLQDTFKDAKEYGSILKVDGLDFDFWDERINYFNQKGQTSLYGDIIKGRLKFTIKQAKLMQQQYECVIANPPYMGSKGMDAKLSEYVKKKYARSKGDMFARFGEGKGCCCLSSSSDGGGSMRQLLNTLFVTSEDIYLALDGENVTANRGGAVVARYPLHTLSAILSFS